MFSDGTHVQWMSPKDIFTTSLCPEDVFTTFIGHSVLFGLNGRIKEKSTGIIGEATEKLSKVKDHFD